MPSPMRTPTPDPPHTGYGGPSWAAASPCTVRRLPIYSVRQLSDYFFMPPQQRRLPLFPLNVVLFPNAVLPLHVFEERYKVMVQRCLDGDSLFGMVLIKSGAEVGDPAEPHSMGTVAHIERVDRLDGGRLVLGVKGQTRFRIIELPQLRPYLEAEVEVLDDDEEEVNVPPQDLQGARDAVTRHVRLLLGVRGGWLREAQMPEDPVALSFFVAAMVQVGLPEKQALLEEPSTVKRLQMGRRIMDTEAAVLRKQVERALLRRVSG